jgi:hypothetical protein
LVSSIKVRAIAKPRHAIVNLQMVKGGKPRNWVLRALIIKPIIKARPARMIKIHEINLIFHLLSIKE